MKLLVLRDNLKHRGISSGSGIWASKTRFCPSSFCSRMSRLLGSTVTWRVRGVCVLAAVVWATVTRGMVLSSTRKMAESRSKSLAGLGTLRLSFSDTQDLPGIVFVACPSALLLAPPVRGGGQSGPSLPTPGVLHPPGRGPGPSRKQLRLFLRLGELFPSSYHFHLDPDVTSSHFWHHPGCHTNFI